MKATRLFAFGFLAVSIIVRSNSMAQDYEARTETHRIRSTHVNDEYLIDVHLPTGYDSTTERYPIVVVLDGDVSSGMARDIAYLLAFGGEIPELIVVAVSYGGTVGEWWDKRSRDLTPTKDRGKIWGDFPLAGGGEAFRKFLQYELMTFIEDNYRVLPDRALAGLSLGGLFAVYSLFTAPDLFNRYIIAGPALAWDREKCWEYEAAFQEGHDRLAAVVFTSVGELDESEVLDPWERFNLVVDSRGYAELVWVTHRFEGETHLSCWPAVLSRGLRAVFTEP